MKERQLIFVTVLVTSGLLIFACQKEISNIINNRDSVSSELIESARIWYGQQLDTEIFISHPNPQWKKSWLTTDRRNEVLVIPMADQYINNSDFSLKRFFLFDVERNTITGGRIIEIVGEFYSVEKNIDHLIKNYDQDIIPGFNGSILQYNVNYILSDEAVFKNGEKSVNEHAVIIYTSANEPNLRASMEVEGACNSVTTRVMAVPTSLDGGELVTFFGKRIYDEEGCPVSVTYTYLSHASPDGGTGGGNGTSCSARFAQFVAGATPTSELVSSNTGQETQYERTRTYIWKCLKDGLLNTWSVKSQEKGTHKKAFGSGADWQWKSFEHQMVYFDGTAIGFTVDPSVTKETVTMGTYFASMTLDLRVVYSFNCGPIQIQKSKDYKSTLYAGT